MNTTTRPTAVYFRTDKNGTRRAYRASWQQLRSFPIGYDKAVAMIATGEAVRILAVGSIFSGSFWKEVR